MHRSGAGQYRAPVESAGDAYATIFQYLAYCWSTPVARDINEAAIAWQLKVKGEYRCDREQYLIVVKKGAALAEGHA